MSQTLDQQRAAFAWECASTGMQLHGKEYKVLAKGAPALIMNSGLMPTLAFYAGKGNTHKLLLNHIAGWFSTRFANRQEYRPAPTRFEEVMARLHGKPSEFYMEATDEALEILKWIRQFVDAVDTKERT